MFRPYEGGAVEFLNIYRTYIERAADAHVYLVQQPLVSSTDSWTHRRWTLECSFDLAFKRSIG